MKVKKALFGLAGVFDGANRVYSDSNPPETLVMTEFASGSVPTPAAGFAILSTPDGRSLQLKDDTALVQFITASVERCEFTEQGTLTVKTGSTRVPIHGGTFNVVSVAITAATAPTGAAVIVDVNKNGTTIYGTQTARPTMAVGTQFAAGGTPTVTSVTTGDYLTIDIDQIGSTVAGAGLVASVRLQRTA